VCTCVCACVRACVCVVVCVCVWLPDYCQLDCSPISTHPHLPRALRTQRHVARTRLLTTSTTPWRNAAATQRWPPRPVTCRTYTLTCATPRSHDDDNNYDYYQAATPPPARAPPVPQHPSNSHQRSHSSKARQRTPCVQAAVRRRNRPTHAANTRGRVVAVPVVVPRVPTRRPPTQAANEAICKINHQYNKRLKDNNTTHTRRYVVLSEVNNTEVLVVVVAASSSAA
jgi:hypothetical protein